MAHCSFFGSAISEVYGFNHAGGVASTLSQLKRFQSDVGFARHDKLPGTGQSEKCKLSLCLQKRVSLSTPVRSVPPGASAGGGHLSPSQPPLPPSSLLPIPADRAESLVTGAASAASASAPLARDSTAESMPCGSPIPNPYYSLDSAANAAQWYGAIRSPAVSPGMDYSSLSRGSQVDSGEASTSGSPPMVWTTLLSLTATSEATGRSEHCDSGEGTPEAIWTALLATSAAVERAAEDSLAREETMKEKLEDSSVDRSSSSWKTENLAPSSGWNPPERLAMDVVSSGSVTERFQAEKFGAPLPKKVEGVILPVVGILPDVKVPTVAKSVSAPEKKGVEGEQKVAPSRVRKIHSQAELDKALKLAGQQLVVLQFAGKGSKRCQALYPDVVDLSRKCTDTIFLLVVGDASEETRQLCKSLNVRHPPHFTFFRNRRRIHDMAAATFQELQASILYYNDSFAPLVQQLESVEAWEALLAQNKTSDKLAVVDISMHQCGPCVRVYPTLINLSKKMSDIAVFARIVGDENDSFKDLLQELDIVEVPTFLFIRQGELIGRYVGSGKGELIGEILRYQGVRITY